MSSLPAPFDSNKETISEYLNRIECIKCIHAGISDSQLISIALNLLPEDEKSVAEIPINTLTINEWKVAKASIIKSLERPKAYYRDQFQRFTRKQNDSIQKTFARLISIGQKAGQVNADISKVSEGEIYTLAQIIGKYLPPVARHVWRLQSLDSDIPKMTKILKNLEEAYGPLLPTSGKSLSYLHPDGVDDTFELAAVSPNQGCHKIRI